MESRTFSPGTFFPDIFPDISPVCTHMHVVAYADVCKHACTLVCMHLCGPMIT